MPTRAEFFLFRINFHVADILVNYLRLHPTPRIYPERRYRVGIPHG